MATEQRLSVGQLYEGMSLPELTKSITQENINLYAEASRDFNPIHIDEAFARQTPLGGTIAHGMLILAYVSQLMTACFGHSWLDGGRLNVRFRAPARPRDLITVDGSVRSIERGEVHTVVSCDIHCHNQNGESVITGEASVRVKDDENSC
jgi:acyl dehydratase